MYARNRGRRVARVIRRIDRLVFVPGRNLPLLAFFFFLVFRRTRTTIDTWRGRRWRGRREREPRSTTGTRKREDGKTEGECGRVAPHILLISVSIVVSVGTPSLRARGAAKGGEGPSIILSSVSLTSHSSPPPLLHLPTLCSSHRSFSIFHVRWHRRSLKTLATMTSFPFKRVRG